MSHVTIQDVNAWFESTKLAVSTIEADLDAQVATVVLARLEGGGFNVDGWLDVNSTPKLVRTILAMHYAAWVYERAYADETEESTYADKLRAYAESLLVAVLTGEAVLEEVESNLPEGFSQPVFFPNDLSSANDPSPDFPSDGGPSFSMGQVF